MYGTLTCSSLDPGGPLGFPLLDLPPLRTVVPSGRVVAVQYRGYPFELMKFLARLEESGSDVKFNMDINFNPDEYLK